MIRIDTKKTEVKTSGDFLQPKLLTVRLKPYLILENSWKILVSDICIGFCFERGVDVDIRFVDILRFVDTFSESENATNEKTQEIQVFFCGKNTKNFAFLVYFS